MMHTAVYGGANGGGKTELIRRLRDNMKKKLKWPSPPQVSPAPEPRRLADAVHTLCNNRSRKARDEAMVVLRELDEHNRTVAARSSWKALRFGEMYSMGLPPCRTGKATKAAGAAALRQCLQKIDFAAVEKRLREQYPDLYPATMEYFPAGRTVTGRQYAKERCGNAKRYKALRAPTCGCRVCNERWFEKQRALSVRKAK